MMLPAARAADLDAMLTDTGQPAVFGAQVTYGILRRVPLTTMDGLSLGDVHTTLAIREGTLTGLVEDATITVDAVAFVIRDVGNVLSDGLRRIVLTELR